MAQLRHDFAAFEQRRTTILVIGPEGAPAFTNYWQEHDLPFIGLPDPQHTILKLYGQQIKLFKFGRMPAQVLVDKNGMARFIHYGHDMADIPTTSEMLALIDEINAESRPSTPENQEN
jgi:peroxiredoxin